jgi:hypothetical protein
MDYAFEILNRLDTEIKPDFQDSLIKISSFIFHVPLEAQFGIRI